MCPAFAAVRYVLLHTILNDGVFIVSVGVLLVVLLNVAAIAVGYKTAVTVYASPLLPDVL
jgi:hypothetical protein